MVVFSAVVNPTIVLWYDDRIEEKKKSEENQTKNQETKTPCTKDGTRN